MRFFQSIKRRQFLTLNFLGLGLASMIKVPRLHAANAQGEKAFLPLEQDADLRQKNIKTIEKWLACTGVSRHKGRVALYAEDFMSGNPAVKNSSQPGMGREAIAKMAKEVEEHPEKEMFQEWAFYNARIYSAVDNPNLFCVNCLGKGRVITTDHPEGVTYQNHYTHYFKLKNGLIQAWWETIVDTPGSDSRPPWEDTGKIRPPMVTFCEGQ
jgi:hypothetical protein